MGLKFEKRHGPKYLAGFLMVLALIFFSHPSFAREEEPERDEDTPSSDGLDAIALRMESLSGSLGQIPDLPQLDQKIQIPELPPSVKNKPASTSLTRPLSLEGGAGEGDPQTKEQEKKK